MAVATHKLQLDKPCLIEPTEFTQFYNFAYLICRTAIACVGLPTQNVNVYSLL